MATENGAENSQLLCLGKNLLAKMNGARLKPNLEQKIAPKKKIQPMPVKSPGKAILQTLQVISNLSFFVKKLTKLFFFKGKSGSFFSRTKISLTKVVAITGVDNDGLVSNKGKRNFCFSTISPSSVKGPDSELADESFEDASPKPTKAKVLLKNGCF